MHLGSWHSCRRWDDEGFRCPFGAYEKEGEKEDSDEDVKAAPYGEAVSSALEKTGVHSATALAAAKYALEKQAEAVPAKAIELESEVGSAFGMSDLGAVLAFYLIVRGVMTMGKPTVAAMALSERATVKTLRGTVPYQVGRFGTPAPRGFGGGFFFQTQSIWNAHLSRK